VKTRRILIEYLTQVLTLPTFSLHRRIMRYIFNMDAISIVLKLDPVVISMPSGDIRAIVFLHSYLRSSTIGN